MEGVDSALAVLSVSIVDFNGLVDIIGTEETAVSFCNFGTLLTFLSSTIFEGISARCLSPLAGENTNLIDLDTFVSSTTSISSNSKPLTTLDGVKLNSSLPVVVIDGVTGSSTRVLNVWYLLLSSSSLLASSENVTGKRLPRLVFSDDSPFSKIFESGPVRFKILDFLVSGLKE
jgi:hypothetical protein